MAIEFGPIKVPRVNKMPEVLFTRSFKDFDHKQKGRILMLNASWIGPDTKILAINFQQGDISGIYSQRSQGEFDAFADLTSEDVLTRLVHKEVDGLLNTAPTID